MILLVPQQEDVVHQQIVFYSRRQVLLKNLFPLNACFDFTNYRILTRILLEIGKSFVFAKYVKGDSIPGQWDFCD